jgi:hypothetical protein
VKIVPKTLSSAIIFIDHVSFSKAVVLIRKNYAGASHVLILQRVSPAQLRL